MTDAIRRSLANCPDSEFGIQVINIHWKGGEEPEVKSGVARSRVSRKRAKTIRLSHD